MRTACASRQPSTINSLYEKHAESVCHSPERTDLQLSQEEAYGRFVVDLLVGPTDLLATELRDVPTKSREEGAVLL